MATSPRERWDRIRRSATVPSALSMEDAERLLDSCDQAEFYDSVAALARPTHGDLLQPLAYDADLPFHEAGTVVVEPNPADHETVHLYGRAAYSGFDAVVMSAMNRRSNDHLMNQLYLRLFREQESVALVTNHGEIIDIAVILGALALAMTDEDRSFGALGAELRVEDVADRLNLVVSRMVATRGVFGMSTCDVLSTFCRTFFSLPQTMSRRRARIDPDLVRASNVVMRQRLADQIAQGGQVLAMAASGSQDLSLAANLAHRVRTAWRARQRDEPEDGPSLHLQPLQAGTMQMMVACEFVLPVAVCLDPATPAVELGQMTAVENEDDCHGVMEWIASAYEAATGTTAVYHRHEDDLLSGVRQALSRRS